MTLIEGEAGFISYSITRIIPCSLSLQLLVKNLQFEDGKMIAAAQYFRAGSSAAVELTEEEKAFAEQMRVGPLLLLVQGKLRNFNREFASEMCFCPIKLYHC